MNEEFPYPSNSRINRQQNPPPKDENPAEEEKRFERVVTGKVIKRKKSLSRRLRDTFLDKNDGVFVYLYKEVLLPAAQAMVVDFFNKGIEKTFYGEVRSGRTTYRGSPSPRTHMSYDRHSTIVRGPSVYSSPLRRPTSTPSAMDIGEIILDSKFAAEAVAEKLHESIEEYGSVTVAALNDLIGQTSVYTDHKWGWTDLSKLAIRRVREGWVLDLPDPIELR